MAVNFLFAIYFTFSCSETTNDNGTSSSSSIAEPGESGTFTDDRDGKVYKYVTIGDQVWMAENLNYSGFDAKGHIDRESSSIPSGFQGICPNGWHLPSTGEWWMLVNAIGGEQVAGTKLKSMEGWDLDGNGTDYYGFSALPGGRRIPESGNFSDIGKYGNWFLKKMLNAMLQ